ncbi:MAG: polyisoprenoid-binding protein [Chloroflexi bacterium HGW-Chloroflexi-3]|nr:MAG: polyisoprenoid-binding protein [Chloroflexi bacterium HGW-Chloroflexi-3]
MSWQIDPAHSLIEFTVTHMMIAKVRGRFNNFSGLVELNESQPEKTSVTVEIDVESIDTRQQQRDDHLRSADFFNIAESPKMKFVGTNVNVIDNKHAKLNGELTIKDITKPVTLNVEFNGISKSPWGSTSAGFSATTKINRKDWALTWNQSLETGGVLVGDEISVNIEIELIKQED